MSKYYKTQASYGTLGSREELAASGYNLPKSFFVDAAPDGSGQMSAAEKAQVDAMGADDSKKAEDASIENKAVVPVEENKTEAPAAPVTPATAPVKPARKAATKSTSKRK